MTPSQPRPQFWPLAALPVAGLIGFATTGSGFSQVPPPAATSRAALKAAQDAGAAAKPILPAPGPESPAGTPARANVVPASDNQISYDVRFIDALAVPWRNFLGARPKCVKESADGSAWIVARKDLDNFLKRIDDKKAAKILAAPKVTSFEKAPATIFTGEQYALAVMEKTKSAQLLAALKAAGPPSPQASVTKRPNDSVGTVVEVSGTIIGDGVLISAGLHDSSLATVDAPGVLTGTVERQCRVSCGVPNGSCLLIRLGRPSHASEASQAVAGSIASARVDDKPAAIERLVVITPRAIVLEAEEQRHAPMIKGSFDDKTR